MKSAHTFLLFLFSLVIISSCSQKKKAEIPPVISMKDFFRNPEKSGYQISPDGQYFSFRAPWKNRMNLFVQKVGDSTAVQVTTDTIRDIMSYFWKGDRLIFSRDINGDENFIVFSASRDGKDVKKLTPEKKVRAELMDDLRGVTGMETNVLIMMNQRNPQVFDPYICDVISGELKVLYDNSKDNFENWITDHTGLIRFAIKTDGTDNVFYYRNNESEPFTEYMRIGYKDSWNPVMFTFDNKNLIVSHNLNGRDKNAIVEWDLAAKKETKLLQDNPDYDMGGVDYSRKRKVITTYTWEGEKMERKIIDEKTKKLFDQLEKKFPGYYISIVSENDDETKRTISINSDRTSGRFYYHEDGKDDVTLLCDRTPWLKEDQMAEMKPIRYTSRDGLTIHGYLTLPVGRDAKNLPVVVNPHGGPWARDSWWFNQEVQFLANRGYAVLQMDFRGSTGYGRKHWESSFKQWGKTMQNDITDGVKWLIKEGIADSGRVAIYGASYGGYATLAGITFTPELYACAVDYVGVSNLFTFMKTIPPYWEAWRKQMYEMVGDPAKDSLLMRAASPVYHVDKIRCPLFVAQGANDPRVNKAESDQMVDAIKKRGVHVEYMVKNDEVHGFYNEENRFDFYGVMEQFLDQHIGSGYKKGGL